MNVRPSPLAILVSLFFFGNIGIAVSAGLADGMTPGGFLILYELGLNWAFSWWVLSDRRARGLPTFIDYGWFVFAAWPVFVPYHLIKTRGLRGCLTMLALLGAFVGACLCAGVVFVVLSLTR